MDKIEEFKRSIERIYHISQNCWDDLSSLLDIKKYSKSEKIVTEDSVISHEYFLLTGSVRAYIPSISGIDRNLRFYSSGVFLGYHIIKHPINEKIQFTYECLSKCIFITIEKRKFRQLIDRYTELKKIAMKIKDEESRWLNFYHKLSTLDSNIDKYNLLKDQFPSLENEIAQYHIASFLGCSPVTLSRIRRDLA